MMTYKSEDTMEASSTPSDQYPVSDFTEESQGWLSKLWLHKMKLPRVSLVYNVIPASDQFGFHCHFSPTVLTQLNKWEKR